MTDQLMRAILALDAYNRGYNAGTKVLANLSQVIRGPTLHVHPVVGRLVDVGLWRRSAPYWTREIDEQRP